MPAPNKTKESWRKVSAPHEKLPNIRSNETKKSGGINLGDLKGGESCQMLTASCKASRSSRQKIRDQGREQKVTKPTTKTRSHPKNKANP